MLSKERSQRKVESTITQYLVRWTRFSGIQLGFNDSRLRAYLYSFKYYHDGRNIARGTAQTGVLQRSELAVVCQRQFLSVTLYHDLFAYIYAMRPQRARYIGGNRKISHLCMLEVRGRGDTLAIVKMLTYRTNSGFPDSLRIASDQRSGYILGRRKYARFRDSGLGAYISTASSMENCGCAGHRYPTVDAKRVHFGTGCQVEDGSLWG